MTFPASAGTCRYVLPVALLIGLPSRNHWYVKVVDESHTPGTAVRVAPTVRVPVIVGMGELVNEYKTRAVGELLWVTAVYPD